MYPTQGCTMAIGQQTQTCDECDMGGDMNIGTILDVLADVLPCSTHMRTLQMNPSQGDLNGWGATEKEQWLLLDEEVYQRFMQALQSSNVTAIFLPAVFVFFLIFDFWIYFFLNFGFFFVKNSCTELHGFLQNTKTTRG
jgi:hypothetical protein